MSMNERDSETENEGDDALYIYGLLNFMPLEVNLLVLVGRICRT